LRIEMIFHMSSSVSLDWLDVMTRLHKFTVMTWTHVKAGK
jgi:hypothetical protein